MTIGYIRKQRVELSVLARHYVEQLKIIGAQSGDNVTMLSAPPQTRG